MKLANATKVLNYCDLIYIQKQGYAILDSQNLHIKIRRCNSEMLSRSRSSCVLQALPGIILLSNIIYELSNFR